MSLHTFDSVEAFALAAATPGRPARAGLAAAMHADFASGLPADWVLCPGVDKRGASTTAVVTLEALVRMVNTGWDAGRDRLTQFAESLAAIVPQPQDIRRRPVWADQGDEVSMERIWSGQLDQAWRATPRSGYGQSKRQVTVAVDAMVGQMDPAESAFWRGAAGVVLANAATEAGYGVQMLVAFRGLSKVETVCRVIVKPYMGGFDLATASAMALPGFFRGLGHAWGFGHLVLGDEVGAGGWVQAPLGYADVSDLAEGSALFIAGQTVNTEADAAGWVTEAVAELDGSEGGGLGNE